MNPTLVTFDDWPLWPERCPADVDFVDYAETSDLAGRRIFHMGTGNHHIVGKNLVPKNRVLGITCSPPEMESYMSWAVENPSFSGDYQVIFGDLYKFEPACFGKFDLITLFHLFERPDARREAYGAATPRDTLLTLKALCLAGGGRVATYIGSATADLTEAAMRECRFQWSCDYKSIRLWTPM